MTKHSKNNTASSIFSYAEYKKLPYGTKRQRLGADSMRPFDACALCLQRARAPVCCSVGHLFCKECVYTDLLAQKKDIKKQKAKLDALRQEQADERQRAKDRARERVLAEFERTHIGLAVAPAVSTSAKEEQSGSRGTKRKFSFDLSAAEAAAREAEEAALRQIEREQAESLKAKLPDFWLPSLTPTHKGAGVRNLDDVKVTTLCRGGQETHGLALKDLMTVEFSTMTAAGSSSSSSVKEEDRTKICLSCKKELSNSIRIFVIKSCSHVVCKTCTDTLIRPSKQCTVCDKSVADEDIIELRREGTGFAGGGMSETKKAGIAFQG